MARRAAVVPDRRGFAERRVANCGPYDVCSRCGGTPRISAWSPRAVSGSIASGLDRKSLGQARVWLGGWGPRDGVHAAGQRAPACRHHEQVLDFQCRPQPVEPRDNETHRARRLPRGTAISLVGRALFHPVPGGSPACCPRACHSPRRRRVSSTRAKRRKRHPAGSTRRSTVTSCPSLRACSGRCRHRPTASWETCSDARRTASCSSAGRRSGPTSTSRTSPSGF